jgi:50S ribosomal subunit-associated GTPase HflX
MFVTESLRRAICLLQKEFEDAWGVKVLDRYSVVLHIFRRNARTREAKLQISLAEIPLLR